MNSKKLFLILSLFLVAVCSLSAASVYAEFEYSSLREPDTTKRRDDELVGVIIKTNIEDAEVFINGEYFGKTPVATVDLDPTYYNLEIRKSGYDTIRCKIYPRRRYTYTYNFTLIKTCGYINVKGAPTGSTIYVDGVSNNSFPLEVAPGSHTVKVRKFGYNDYSETFYVENHKTVNASISLKPAPFTIQDFKISKNVINPDYNSGIGRVNFSFYVTNTGTAILSVNDRYGNQVWSYHYSSFSTWQQSITWDGRGSEGERLPDGQYTVELTSLDYDFSARIKIDRSMIYPLSVPTTLGSGLGTLPCAFASGMNYVKLYTTFGPSIQLTDGKASLTSVPINGGILVDFANHFELGGSIGGAIAGNKNASGNSGSSLNGGVSFKGTGGIEFSSDLHLNFAGLMHYNYNTLCNGLGFGAAVGLETSSLYFGMMADYTLGSMGKKPSAGDVLKCGGVVSVLPTRNLRTSVWASLYNTDTLEAGAEFITMPAASAFCFDAKAWVMADLNSKGKNLSINAQIGLSYLF